MWYIFIAVLILIFGPQNIFTYLIFATLFSIGLIKEDITGFFIKKLKIKNPITLFLIVFLCSIALCSQAKPNIPPTDLSKINMNANSLEQDIEKILKNYKPSSYEEIADFAELACAIETRLVYIKTEIENIKQTNTNIVNRKKNLLKRKKNYVKNISKINKRADNANSKHFIVEVPNIAIDEIDLLVPRKKIHFLATEITKNINNPDCSNKCAFRHIDTYSISIIKEIDNIHEKQNIENIKLCDLERSFDKLEYQQRKIELDLTRKGF